MHECSRHDHAPETASCTPSPSKQRKVKLKTDILKTDLLDECTVSLALITDLMCCILESDFRSS